MHFDRFTWSTTNAVVKFFERRILTMVDHRALRRLGLSFGALTVVVTLIGAAVVKQHIDGKLTVDLVESPAVEVAATR
jgi:hypothetical protein